MRIHRPWTPSYLDVDQSFLLKPLALIRAMEEAAIMHTNQVGLSAKHLLQGQGLAWVMHKIGINIHRLPSYGHELTVSTWSKGIQGFRALREFEIWQDQEPLVAATSLWLLYDTNRQRLIRIPEDMAAAYEIEQNHAALDWDLATWKPPTDFPSQSSLPITTRASDFDIYGHVNHALYVDYIDTALTALSCPGAWTGGIKLAFLQQIPSDVREVHVHLGTSEHRDLLRIAHGQTVFALAERGL